MGDPLSIAIGVVTCNRPQWLARLLESIAAQRFSGTDAVRVRVIVVDNDLNGANREVVATLRQKTNLSIEFVEEPEPGIPFARNACVRAALGDDALIFIDDDEWAPDGWLENIVRGWRETGADIVMGPMSAVLPNEAPDWALHSGIFNKMRDRRTGDPIRCAFTYNTLVSGRVLRALGPTFDPAFRYSGSSDLHYFSRAALQGFTTVWCREALVYEEVPPERLRLGWLVRRGYRVGVGGSMTARMLHAPSRAMMWIAPRVGGHAVFGVFYLMQALVRPKREGIWALWRLSIAAGFVGGLFGLRYEEYKSRLGECEGDDAGKLHQGVSTARR